MARLNDPDIHRYMPYQEVRKILLSRYPAQLSVNRLELKADSASTYEPSADKSRLTLNKFS